MSLCCCATINIIAQSSDNSYLHGTLRSTSGEVLEISNKVKKCSETIIIKFDETTCNQCVFDLLAELEPLGIVEYSNIMVVGFFTNLRSQKLFENDNKLTDLTYHSQVFFIDEKLFKSSKPTLFVINENCQVIRQIPFADKEQIVSVIKVIMDHSVR